VRQCKQIIQVNTKAWRNVLQRAGIQDFRWRDLRHTFAAWHREAGTPTHELQRLGGWKTQSMVERYAHVAPEGLQLAASRLPTIARYTLQCAIRDDLGIKPNRAANDFQFRLWAA